MWRRGSILPYSGRGVHLPAEIVPQNTWNRDLYLKSTEEVKRIGNSGAAVIYGHDLAQWSDFKTAEEAYE